MDPKLCGVKGHPVVVNIVSTGLLKERKDYFTLRNASTLHPHLRCVVSRGVWLAGGQWVPVPYIDTHAAEILFREKVFRLLQQHDLLSDERIKIRICLPLTLG